MQGFKEKNLNVKLDINIHVGIHKERTAGFNNCIYCTYNMFFNSNRRI